MSLYIFIPETTFIVSCDYSQCIMSLTRDRFLQQKGRKPETNFINLVTFGKNGDYNGIKLPIKHRILQNKCPCAWSK